MKDYTVIVEKLLKEALDLPKQYRAELLQKFFFGVIKRDNDALIPLAQKLGATNIEIARALGVHDSLISRHYPKKGK